MRECWFCKKKHREENMTLRKPDIYENPPRNGAWIWVCGPCERKRQRAAATPRRWRSAA